MNISEVTSDMMQNLGQRWYDAAKNDIKTPLLMKLCSDTEKAVTILENSSLDVQDNSEKIMGLRHAVAEGFSTLGTRESESLAKWIGHHSEAYQTLHHLLEVLEAKKDSEIFYPAQDNSLSNLALIDSRSLSYLTEVNEVDKEPSANYIEVNKQSSNIPDEMKLSMCDFMNVKELLTMRTISKQSAEIANYVLIDRLNTGKISFSDLNIVTENDLNVFFGESAYQVFYFHIENDDAEDISDTIKEASPPILCLSQLSADALLYVRETSEQYTAIVNTALINLLNSGKISFSDLKIVTENDLKALLGSRASEIIRLEIKAPETLVASDTSPPILCVAQLATIKELELPFLYIDSRPSQDISALKHCRELKTLLMSTCFCNYDISVLRHCPNLETLDISYTNIPDISILSHCPKLKIVFINGTKVTDVSVLMDLRKNYNVLEKVQMMHCAIPEEALEKLEDLGLDLIA